MSTVTEHLPVEHATHAAYEPARALLEHMLSGHPITIIEALVLFGVQNPNAEFARIKKDGFWIESRRIPLATAVRRINQYATLKPPADLPTREITVTEYRIKK